MKHWYNDHDPQVCAWLRELIRGGHLPQGDVDERSITDVDAADLRGYTACHFFAGIGGWPYALRLAGWPDDRPVWTGSPPCQPFSTAGRRRSRDDDRHLAPTFLRLVGAGCPRVLFGEQVASADVVGKADNGTRRDAATTLEWAWFDDLADGLEALGYAVGATDLPAACVGAPHIRQRLFFGAVRQSALAGRGDDAPGGLAQHIGAGLEGHAGHGDRGCEPGRISPEPDGSAAPQGATGGLADGDGAGPQPRRGPATATGYRNTADTEGGANRHQSPRPDHDFWRDADWLFCRDGKWRPVEPAVLGVAARLPGGVVRVGAERSAAYPLSDKVKGVKGRVMRLRGYGNSIVPQVAAEFVRAFDETARNMMEADQ